MKWSRTLMGLMPPCLCAGMITCLLAAFLFNRHNHRWMFGLTVPWVIAPYVVIGVISYLGRNYAVVFVFGLISAITCILWSSLPALLTYSGRSEIGMELFMVGILQWAVIGGAIGAALVIVLVHKLWQFSMTKPAPSRVAWGTAGAVFGALGGTAAVIVMKLIAFNVVGELTGAISAGVVGAIVGGFLRGMGNWRPRTFGGGLGGAVGGLCAVLLADDKARAGGVLAFYACVVGALPGIVAATAA